MPAFTSRLNLYKPGGGSSGLILPDEVLDVDRLNNNFDAIDAAVGARVVTSGTRPASPYNGQAIYESDTGNIRVWNSGTSRWELPSPSVSVADFTALAALSTAVFRTGDVVYVVEGNVEMRRVGSSWVQVNTAVFADAATRDTAYAKASAAYRVVGAESRASATDNFVRTWNGTIWAVDLAKTTFKRNAASLATNASFSAVDLNDASWGTDFTRTALGVYTCQRAGEYRIRLNFSYAGNATGTRGVRLLLSAGSVARQRQDNAVGSLDFSISLDWLVTVAQNDTITTQAQQNSGGSLNLSGDLLFERVN